jgi:putative hydrolase
MALSNRDLAELMARAAEGEEAGSNRRRALLRAARSAYQWPEEVAALMGDGRPLTELSSVGPWLAGVLSGWLTAGEPPEQIRPSELRHDFLTLAEVRSTLAEDWVRPRWGGIRADLQMHSTYSDGRASVEAMVEAAAGYGYSHVLITDHSKGLKIAGGMNEEELAEQGREIASLNAKLTRRGIGIRALQGIEMNLSPDGDGDMDPAALARLDLVLGAFHSKLRTTDDQTDRYLAALRNPDIHVLAHPRGRRFNVRLGLRADWPRVFAEAALRGTAMEIDAHPDRQDLNVELLEMAREAGVTISIGTDAHSAAELRFMQFGLAAAARAGIPTDRILNFRSADDLLFWAQSKRRRRMSD